MAQFYLNRLYVLGFLSIFGLLFGCNVVGGVHEPTITASGALTIKPEQVTNEDVIALTFPQKHPENMAIRAPDKKWYTVHEPSEGIFFLPAEKFKIATSLTLNVKEVKGVTWTNGQKTTKIIFTVPGEYLIYMADNLETEPENTFFISKSVNFK